MSAVQADTLRRICWLLFPFPDLGDAPYARAVDAITSAASDDATAQLIVAGIADLDGGTAGSWLRLDEAAQIDRLRGIESGPFFAYMLATTKAQLFNDRDVWAHIGYEGSSLEHGGYIGRGLSDIDWLDDGARR